jgi:hypothetical protein
VGRRVLAEIDADPEALKAQIQEEANKGARARFPLFDT